MTYYVCSAFMLILLFFLRFDYLGKQLSQSKTTWKPTQRIVQRLIFLIIGSGTLTGQITPFILLFSLDKNSDEFIIATTAILTLVLFILPGHPPYYAITSGILGKMYSNTMMVILNNRIVFQAKDESTVLNVHVSSSTSTMSNPGISQRPAFSTSHGGTLVTHKQWTIPLDVYETQHVSIRYPSFSLTLVLIFPIFVLVDIRIRKN